MDRDNRKVFFIINRYSGTGHKAELEEMIHQACKAASFEVSLTYTEGPAHATTLAIEAVSSGFGRVVAVGGDGTANEVAQGLLHTPAAMGVIPKGSGNGLARHLGIPLRAGPALNCLLACEPVTIDTFKLNNRLSLNVSGIGFDGYVANLFANERKRGLQGYTRLILNEFRQFREFDARVTVGRTTMTKRAFVIAIANSSQYGNNAKIAPAASVIDGLLDICALKKVPPYRLDLIYSFFNGTLDQTGYCEHLQTDHALIELEAPVPYHIDGEPAGHARSFKIDIMPQSLSILAPGIGRF